MRQTTQKVGFVLALIVTLGLYVGGIGPARAQANQRCFVEIGYCIAGRIRDVWERSGGLAVFGFPIGPEQQVQVDGQQRPFQMFERQRIELHPTTPAPYNVLLGRLGAELLAQQGRDWWQFPRSTSQANCEFFAQTGHNVCGAFLDAWRIRGIEFDGRQGVSSAESLALFGLPLSDEQSEVVNGQTRTVQWFERARFEWHPENPVAYRVLFGLLGREMGDTAAIAPPPNNAPPTTATETPTAPASPATATSTSGGTAPTRTPSAPTSTRVIPTATGSAVSPTAVPATNTRVPPTNTSVPPTNTPLPTATPLPSGSLSTPGQGAAPPPGFAPYGGLPSRNTGVSSEPSIGVPVCLESSELLTNTTEVQFVLRGPGTTVEQFTVDDITGGPGGRARLRWAPRPGYDIGVYSVTTTQLAGTSVLTTTTKAITVTDTLADSGERMTAIRLNTRVSSESVNNCNDGTHGAPGDSFLLLFSGFKANQLIEAYLYGEAGCTQQQKD